jgi:hypothetical protein
MLSRLLRLVLVVLLLPWIAAAAMLFLILELGRAGWRKLTCDCCGSRTDFHPPIPPNRLP